ncbi:VIT domain-containing protein [Gemmata sp.]|uniref:VIT domain-containing protein n=1 Tax=Gemmata sp. TaxID=1914242 RepID=UPI003F710814
MSTTRGNLPLAALEVRGRVTGLLVRNAVTQTFVNTHAEPLEATYVFPLPDRFAVTRFRFEVAGRVIEGQLKEREQARQEYAEAIQAGHRAAIAEEDRPDVFTMRVGNLMPGESATVRLDLSGPLAFHDGEATFRFPLVVAPRYIPGAALERSQVGTGTAPDTDAVPDASRITPAVLLPGYPNPVRLALSLDIDPQPPATDFRCSLHAVLESTNAHGTHRVALHPGERLDRDFVLRWKVGGAAVTASLICTPDQKAAGEGTFALTLVPPAGLAGRQRPRDVAFVLDRSGSMGGWKMVAARRAMARMVETLTPRDRFAALAFDDRIDVPPGFESRNLVAATDRNRYLADQFFATLDARGGTEMAVPLEHAAEALRETSSDRERILVLVTDGQIGNEDQILNHLSTRIRGARVFALGIDQAVNAGFLNRLAGLGRGACELIESEARLDEVTDRVHRHLGTPVLMDVKLGGDLNIVRDSVTPARLPDLFAGSALTVFGRYRATPASIAVRAGGSDGEPWHASAPAAVAETPAVEHAWARGRVRALEDQYAISSDAKLAKQIVETSLRFGVLCRFTAFVAVDRSEVVNAGGEVHAVAQPVEAPAGWVEGALNLGKRLLGALAGGVQPHVSQPVEFRKGLKGIAESAPGSPPAARPAPCAAPAPMTPSPAKANQSPPLDFLEACADAPAESHYRAAPKKNYGGAASYRKRAAAPAPGKPNTPAPEPAAKTEIAQLSTDHSVVQAMVESKTISREEASDHRFKNVLWKYLGSKEVGEGPEVLVVPGGAGDRFVLCTDGVTGVVPAEDLLAFMRAATDPRAAAEGLVKLALDSGSRDNASCVVAVIGADDSLATGSCCHQGNYRENNEDAVAVVRFGDWTVCLVADGTGGQAAGEVASKTAVESLGKLLAASLPGLISAEGIKAAIRDAIVTVNEEIMALGAADPNLKNMGSTIVLCAWRTGVPLMFVANVGDSRAYHIKRGS